MDDSIDLEKILEEHKLCIESKGDNGKRLVLKDKDLQHCNFKGANLFLADFEGSNLTASDFRGAVLVAANLNNTNLIAARFEDADLRRIKINGAICERTNFERSIVTGIEYDQTGIFNGARIESCYGSPMFKRFVQDQDYLEEFRKNHKYWYIVWSLFADCGQSFGRWACWSFFFAILFACAFYGFGEEAFCLGNGADGITWGPLTTLYYSVVTFTTLGFGDITPKSTSAIWLVMAEVILGYVMLGGLISIFANKIARRS